jgi:hypothetical protein
MRYYVLLLALSLLIACTPAFGNEINGKRLLRTSTTDDDEERGLLGLKLNKFSLSAGKGMDAVDNAAVKAAAKAANELMAGDKVAVKAVKEAAKIARKNPTEVNISFSSRSRQLPIFRTRSSWVQCT